MDEEEARAAAVPRRGVLKALALAPAAVAGCAAARAERPARAEEGRSLSVPSRSAAAVPGAAVAAIRAFPVPADAEPAFVFRAAGARPREP
jgi:hypothetical protein